MSILSSLSATTIVATALAFNMNIPMEKEVMDKRTPNQLILDSKLYYKDITPTYTLNGQNRDSHGAEGHLKTNLPYKEMEVTATAYVSYCDTGCTGITATGVDVRNTIRTPKGYRVVAVDPRVIPLGSIVEINGEKFKAVDTGGAIKGNKIDILVSTHNTDKAFEFGKQKLHIKVY
jgi:3D (Asp-Asp-Asp) domain-containing protein